MATKHGRHGQGMSLVIKFWC